MIPSPHPHPHPHQSAALDQRKYRGLVLANGLRMLWRTALLLCGQEDRMGLGTESGIYSLNGRSSWLGSCTASVEPAVATGFPDGTACNVYESSGVAGVCRDAVCSACASVHTAWF